MVSGRTRRLVGDLKRLVVTYRVKCSDDFHNVDAWEPTSILEVGELVSMPVKAKAFQGRNGGATSVMLTVRDERDGAF